MTNFTAWCIMEDIDKEPFKAFIERRYPSPYMMMTNTSERAFAWREYLANYYVDKGLLWTMINQLAPTNYLDNGWIQITGAEK